MALQANGLRNMVIGSLDNVGKFLTQNEKYSSVPLVDWAPNRLRTVATNFKQRGLDAENDFQATTRDGLMDFPDVMVAPTYTDKVAQQMFGEHVPDPIAYAQSAHTKQGSYRRAGDLDTPDMILPPGERVAAVIGRYPLRTAGAVGGGLTIDTVLGNPVLGTVGGVVDGATLGLTNFKPNEEDYMMENPYPPSPERQVAMEGMGGMQPMGGGVYQPNAEEMQREHDRLQRTIGFNNMTLQEIRKRQAVTGSQPNQW